MMVIIFFFQRVQPHNYPDFTYQNGSIVSSSIENRQSEKYYISNSGSPVRQRKTVVLVKPQENGYGGTLPRCSTFAPPPEIRVNPLSATLDRKTNSSSLSCCSRPRQGSPEMPPQLPPRTETLSRKPPLPPVTSQVCIWHNFKGCMYVFKKSMTPVLSFFILFCERIFSLINDQLSASPRYFREVQTVKSYHRKDEHNSMQKIQTKSSDKISHHRTN